MSDKPHITVKLNDRGQFEPVSLYDAEQLAECSRGQTFTVIPMQERSIGHQKLYWSILGKVVKSTGRWATPDHLHRDLKMACGYYQTVASEMGGIYYSPDSTAMKKMSQKDFNKFFESAMQKLSETIGYDPLTGLQ